MDLPKSAGEPARAAVHILPVPKRGYLIVCFAGPVRGLNMHWRAGGSVPCLPDELCPAALHRSGTTWKGFAPCREWSHTLGLWVPWVLEVTEGAEELLRGYDLRGQCWRFSRVPGKGKARRVMGVLEETRTEPELLRPFDVVAVINRRWHCQDLIWDVPNPIKPKLTLAPTSAAPPNSLPIFDPHESTGETDSGRSEYVNRFQSKIRELAGKNGQAETANGRPGAGGKEDHV